MKKSIFLFVLVCVVLITTGLWFFNDRSSIGIQDILLYSVILISLGFAIVIGISRLRSIQKGEPTEDELSKKIMRKASSLSFYTSIYGWLLLSYINDRLNLEAHTIIGAGILLMAIIFFGFWTFFKIRGINHE